MEKAASGIRAFSGMPATAGGPVSCCAVAEHEDIVLTYASTSRNPAPDAALVNDAPRKVTWALASFSQIDLRRRSRRLREFVETTNEIARRSRFADYYLVALERGVLCPRHDFAVVYASMRVRWKARKVDSKIEAKFDRGERGKRRGTSRTMHARPQRRLRL